MAHFPLLLSPLASSPFYPFVPPFYLLGTLLAVTGIVHLGLRLLVNWPPLSHPSPKPSPSKIPRTLTAQRLTKTTSEIFRLLLSGTIMIMLMMWVDDDDGYKRWWWKRRLFSFNGDNANLRFSYHLIFNQIIYEKKRWLLIKGMYLL
jgi:hypothetical protein